MLISSKKKLNKKLIAIILILTLVSGIVVSLASLSKKDIVVASIDIREYVMAMDLGFSSILNLTSFNTKDSYKQSQKLSYKIKSVLQIFPKSISYKLSGISKLNFDRIDLDIDFPKYQKILEDRQRGLDNSILTNPREVNAKIMHKGNTYKVDIRLKGDFADHWLSKNRMSFRLSVKGKGTVLGFKKFSIQKPRARQFPYDNIFQDLNRSLGNLAPIHKYVHLYVNGDNWGIMGIEEHISKEFLEKQGRKESIVVRFSDENIFEYKRLINPYPLYRLSDPSLFSHLYGRKKYLKDNYFRSIYSYIVKNRVMNESFLFDVDSLAKSYILSTAWGSWHTLANNNSRYYFNPYTLKLETITTDQLAYQDNTSHNDYHSDLPRLYSDIISTEEFKKNAVTNLNAVNKSILNIQNVIQNITSNFPVDTKKSDAIIKENLMRIDFDKNKYLYHQNDNLEKKEEIDIILPTKQQASNFFNHLHFKHYINGDLAIYNLLPDSVAIKGVYFNGISLFDKEFIIPSYISNPEPTILKTPYLEIQDRMFTITSEYQGVERTSRNEASLFIDDLINPLLIDTVSKFNFISKLNDNKYEIKTGSWDITEPIVISGDLKILPSTTLTFSKDSYLIIKGSLTAIGSDSKPIILKAKTDSWKGIYVLNSRKKSHIENAIISNLNALEDKILKLSGGITFYKADVDFTNVKVIDIKAEDAINIIESSFNLNYVDIENTFSDGLDSDFSSGTVTNSKFSSIGGDALDFSGSEILIERNTVIDVRDKAVSAGEMSNISIYDSSFKNINIGIASKDASDIKVYNTSILNYGLYAAITYQKKDFYNIPSLDIFNCITSPGTPYLRQAGSMMTVDNLKIPESEISLQDLNIY